MLRFLFVLSEEFLVKVPEDGHIFRDRILKVIFVNQSDASVYDGLFNGLKAFPASHDQFAQGEDEIAFQGQGILVFAVVQVQVHRVYIIPGVCGYLYDLSSKMLREGSVFRLGVAYDDVVVRHKEHV